MDKLIEIGLNLSEDETEMVLHALEVYSMDMVTAATVSGDYDAHVAHESIELIIKSIESQAGLAEDDSL